MYLDCEDLLKDLNQVRNCLHRFLCGRLSESVEELGRVIWPDYDSMTSRERLRSSSTRFYVVYGYACLSVNKAALSFSLPDIESAKHYVHLAKNSAYYSTPSWWKTRQTSSKVYSLIELHALLVSAECDFLVGLLSILHSLVLMHLSAESVPIWELPRDLPECSGRIPTIAHFYGAECLYTLLEPHAIHFSAGVSLFIHHFARLARAGLSLMHSHNSFEHLLKVVNSNDAEFSSDAEKVLFDELKCGVYVIIGAIKLFSAVLPKKCLALLQILHKVGSDKKEGLRMLEIALDFDAMRKVLSINSILSYQLVFLHFVGPVSEVNSTLCSKSVAKLNDTFPGGSFLSDFFNGRFYLTVETDILKSEKFFENILSRELERDLYQVDLIAQFELLWIFSYECRWREASKLAAILAQSTYWSSAYFSYLHCLFTTCSALSDAENNSVNCSVAKDSVTRGKMGSLEEYFACSAQIKPIVADRLACKRGKLLIEDPYICFVLVLEALFWHDEFRLIHYSQNKAKLVSLLNEKLMLREILNEDGFKASFTNCLVLVFGSAILTGAKFPEEFDVSDVLVYLEKLKLAYSWRIDDLDVRLLLRYAIFKISVNAYKTWFTLPESNDFGQSDSIHLLKKRIIEVLDQPVDSADPSILSRLHGALESFKHCKDLTTSKSAYSGRLYCFVRSMIEDLSN